jgi:hypothetical protein
VGTRKVKKSHLRKFPFHVIAGAGHNRRSIHDFRPPALLVFNLIPPLLDQFATMQYPLSIS